MFVCSVRQSQTHKLFTSNEISKFCISQKSHQYEDRWNVCDRPLEAVKWSPYSVSPSHNPLPFSLSSRSFSITSAIKAAPPQTVRGLSQWSLASKWSLFLSCNNNNQSGNPPALLPSGMAGHVVLHSPRGPEPYLPWSLGWSCLLTQSYYCSEFTNGLETETWTPAVYYNAGHLIAQTMWRVIAFVQYYTIKDVIF